MNKPIQVLREIGACRKVKDVWRNTLEDIYIDALTGCQQLHCAACCFE